MKHKLYSTHIYVYYTYSRYYIVYTQDMSKDLSSVFNIRIFIPRSLSVLQRVEKKYIV